MLLDLFLKLGISQLNDEKTKLESCIDAAGLNVNEKQVLHSLLSCFDDDFFASVNFEDLLAHVCAWYESALSSFSADTEGLYDCFLCQKAVIEKVACRGSRFNLNFSSMSPFSVLFVVNNIQESSEPLKRDCLRFVYFHLMRRAINKSQSADKLIKLAKDFDKHCIKKRTIPHIETAISTVHTYLSGSHSGFTSKLLKDFFADFAYLSHDQYFSIPLVQVEDAVSVLETNRAIECKQPSIIKLIPCELLRPPFLKSPQVFEAATHEQQIPYPIESKQTDFLSFRRHPVSALCLPMLSYSLLKEEKLNLIIELTADVRELKHEAILYMLMVSSAKEKDEILSMHVHWSEKINGPGIYPRIHLLVIEHLDLVNKYRATPHPFLNNHQSYIALPISETLCNSISQLEPKREADYLFQILEYQKFEDAYKNQLKHRAKITKRVLSDKVLQYLLFDEIAQNSDMCMASLILATDKFSNPMTLYYLSADAKSAMLLYKNCADSIGLKLGVQNYYPGSLGSELSVNTAAFKKRLLVLQDELNAGIQYPQSVDDFNQVACYTALVFMLNGLARRTRALFFDESTVLLEKQLLLVCDKYTEAYSAVRILPLTDVAIEQFNVYKRALKHFTTKLRGIDSNASSRLNYQYKFGGTNGLPFLCQLKNDQIEPISTADVMTWLGLDLPENFSRHLVSSSLHESIGNYRQVLLGHYNRYQHSGDAFRLNRVDFPEEVRQGLNQTLIELGVSSLNVPTIAGKCGTTNVKDTLFEYFYPHGWLGREEDNKRIVILLKKALNNDIYSEKNRALLTEKIADLETSLIATLTSSKYINLVQKHLRVYLDYFKQTDSIALRKNLVNEQYQCTTSLKVFEHERQLDHLRELFLEYASDKMFDRKTLPILFMLSVALFQPAYIKRIFHDKPKQLFLTIFNKTLFATYIDNYDVEQTYALNSLSVSCIIKSQALDTPLPLNFDEIGKQYKAFFAFIKSAWRLPCELYMFSSLNKLVHFCIQYSILDYSALARTDGHGHSLAATHYPLEELQRLLLPFHAVHRKSLVIDDESKPLSPRYFIGQYQKTADVQIERKVFRLLHQFFNQTLPNHLDLLSQFQTHAASTLNAKQDDKQSIMHSARKYSQYFQCMLLYMFDCCSRQSKRKKQYAPVTLYSYFSTIDSAFHRLDEQVGEVSHIEDIHFAELDDETYIEIYRLALNNTHRDNKKELISQLKIFHQRLVELCGIEDVEWDAFFPELYARKQPKGIARAMIEDEYQKAYHYIASHTDIDEVKKDEYLAILILGWRAGLRKREVKNLKRYDINIDQWLINIGASHLFATKAVNSPRVINISNYLNDDERAIVKKVVERVRLANSFYKDIFLFANAEDQSFIRVNHIFNELTNLLKQVTGNPQFRFYDLRHNFINYHLLLFSGARNDEKYHASLSKWSRSTCLDSFYQDISNMLLNNIAETGAVLILAFAKMMGHAVLTQREYYQHCLALISEVEANVVVDKYLSHKHRKAFHVLEEARYTKHFNKQIRIYLNRSIGKVLKRPQTCAYLIDFNAKSYDTETMVLNVLRLHTIVYQDGNFDMALKRHHVVRNQLARQVDRLGHFVQETEHEAIPIGSFINEELYQNERLVKQYSHYSNNQNFRLLLKQMFKLHLCNNQVMSDFTALWYNRASVHTLIVREEEAQIVQCFLDEFSILDGVSSNTYLSKKLRHSGKEYKFKLRGAKKFCMEKFSCALALFYSSV